MMLSGSTRSVRAGGLFFLATFAFVACWPVLAQAELRAGAAAIDITPPKLPVLVNGGMRSRSVDRVNTRLHARAIVVDDGKTRIAMVVVDSCMVNRELLDQAKQLASLQTGIPPERILISATHTHSAPSAYGVLGTDTDPNYPPFLRTQLATAIQRATKNLEPAEIGWGVGNAADYTAVRRWIRRPDKVTNDPFGNPTVRANMHPGYRSLDAMGPSGPIDPSLSIISIRTKNKRPIALFANFSMHYYGDKDLSADYYGLFANRIKQKVLGQKTLTGAPDFVGVMSHGCSGDIYLRDYLKPAPKTPHTISTYTDAIVNIAYKTYQAIDNYRSDATVDMAQAELPLRYRTPDKQRLEWAQRIVDKTEGLPKTTEEVYAREAVILHKLQQTKVVLQAIRIGEIGLTGMPNEVYALTGLKVKAMSPLKHTITIDLANGADGYIPPPEQHFLGGYNTWPARSAGLEVQAEPKIVETVMQLLERVAKRRRRAAQLPLGSASKALIATKPAAYWRLNDFQMPDARDQMGRYDGMFEMGVAFYLKGPHSPTYTGSGAVNRSVHFAGGRMRSRIRTLESDYSFSAWLWNGMPNDARGFGGYLFSRGHDQSHNGLAEHLGIGGKSGNAGKLVFVANRKRYVGKTVIPRWTWTHVTCSRKADRVQVYVNGVLEIDAPVATRVSHIRQVFVGGRNDNRDNFEGRLDEVAIWTRALSAKEANTIYRAAQPQD